MNTEIKKKHIKDTNQLAKLVVDLTTGETEDKPKRKEKKPLVKKPKG